MDYEQMLTE